MPDTRPTLGSSFRTLFALLRASTRLSKSDVRLAAAGDLETLVEELRGAGRAGADAGTAVDPGLVPRLLERLLIVLPPYRLGRCVKRSLFLLDLWSRAGLSPALHLGFRTLAGGTREGHAWVTTEDPRYRCVKPEGVVEAFEL